MENNGSTPLQTQTMKQTPHLIRIWKIPKELGFYLDCEIRAIDFDTMLFYFNYFHILMIT